MIVLAYIAGMLFGFCICFFGLFLPTLRIAKDAVATSNKCIRILKGIDKELKNMFGADAERSSGKERIH